jgi:hypothetical protein
VQVLCAHLNAARRPYLIKEVYEHNIVLLWDQEQMGLLPAELFAKMVRHSDKQSDWKPPVRPLGGQWALCAVFAREGHARLSLTPLL